MHQNTRNYNADKSERRREQHFEVRTARVKSPTGVKKNPRRVGAALTDLTGIEAIPAPLLPA
jgi:hypothetical protein